VNKTLNQGVLEVLEQHRPGLLLDIPTGDSPVTKRAQELDYKVVGVELFPPPGFKGVQADACARLPFQDDSFETLVSMEGIEHFENQAGFVRECARVLRPGGLMILTTPNVMHLSARISGFLTAQRALKRGFINEDQTLRGREGHRTYHGHAFLIDAIRLRYLVAIEGLTLKEVRRGKWSHRSLLLAPLIPLIWLATRLALRTGKKTRVKEGLEPARPEVEEELRGIADSPNLMLCRQLIVTATKTGSR
jgi:SAM-dependent methyltransferase